MLCAHPLTSFSSLYTEGPGNSGLEDHPPLLMTQDTIETFQRQVVLHVVGEGKLGRVVRALTDALGLPRVEVEANKTEAGEGPVLHPSAAEGVTVYFHGSESRKERVAAMLRASDALVNPIELGETFGFVHLEAAAMGTPVVSFYR